MYIAIYTSKEKNMIESMQEALKTKFPTYKFTVEPIEKRGYQLQLHGSHEEIKPTLFAEGFASGWENGSKAPVKVKFK